MDVDAAFGLEHLGKAGLRVPADIQDPSVLHTWRAEMVIESPRRDRPEVPEAIPGARVIAASEVDPKEGRPGWDDPLFCAKLYQPLNEWRIWKFRQPRGSRRAMRSGGLDYRR